MLIVTSSYRFSCHTYQLKSPNLLSTQKAEFKKHGPRNWQFQTEGSLVNKLIRLNCAPNDASYLGNVNDLKSDHSNKYEEKDNQDEFEEAKERIRESFRKIELSPSSYDTAWVAMVPSRHSLKEPCFPQCLDWIIENQREDGSWGLNPSHPLLVKDSLSSTLACLLALSKWGVGDKQVQRGLGFIETNGWAVNKKDQISSVGFEIIFASMVKYAKKLNLNLPLDSEIVNLVIHKRDSTIDERALQNDFKGNLANLEYMGEGLGELCDWKEIIMSHQRQNGSLFDSPATTAGALIYHQHDKKCSEYLNSILKQHKNWVPTIYPTKMHSLLYLVDTLQCLGVDRYFKTEIKEVLDETYRLWQQKDEEIFSNVTHCAMAFRLLRMSNYQVSSDDIEELANEEHCFSISKKLMSHVGIIELHKTSQIAIHGKDHILDKIGNWTGTFMQQRLLNNDFLDRKSKKEVEFASRKFYATYDRVENRRYIEAYEVNNFRILKAAYRSPNFNNKDLLRFSVLDFNLCQAQHQQELQQLKRWDECSPVQYHSERVKMFFSALYMTVEELAAKANIRQGRCVKVHLINLWIDLLKHMLIESEWWRSKTTPSIEEYLSIACVSVGVECVVLTTQYLLGPKLPYDLTQSFEISALWNSTAIVARLLNDIHTYKREQSESSPNMISILIAQSNGTISEEEAIIHIKEMLENKRRELLCMVVTQRKGSQLEQVCKDLFWKTFKLVYSLYSHGDELRFPEELKKYINQVMYKPLNDSQ